MLPIQKRWHVAPPITPEAEQELTDYPPYLRQILYNRGYTTSDSAQRFLDVQTPEEASPLILKTMPEAVDRLRHAIDAHEPIAIYGDYDADGVTATALLIQALRSLDAKVQEYIPNRFDEGYGVNKDALTTLHERGVKLVVTVDCGMRSAKETEHANHLGVDLIITDHHLPGDETPRAIAIINPKQLGDNYPYKDMAGVGLAYKLTDALFQSFDISPNKIEEYLDLVAIGTVADMAPLTGENRWLVRNGLMRMRRTNRQGLMSLIGVSGLRPERLTATNLGFAIGPRLNAAGRLDSALASLRLLLTEDVNEAGKLAQELDNQNRERQKITREIQTAAESIARVSDPETLLIFASHPDFNAGVVGLAASRLCEQYYRPAIVAHQDEEITIGSCRSIPEFHITNALDECADLMEKYGGHAAAAGFTIRNENLPALVTRLEQIAQSQLGSLDLRPLIKIDAEVTFKDMRYAYEELEKLQPTGLGNPTPIFVSRGVRVENSQVIGKQFEHLRLTVKDSSGIVFNAIAFRQGHVVLQKGQFIDLAFTLELNEFNGRSSLQLNVRDLKICT